MGALLAWKGQQGTRQADRRRTRASQDVFQHGNDEPGSDLFFPIDGTHHQFQPIDKVLADADVAQPSKSRWPRAAPVIAQPLRHAKWAQAGVARGLDPQKISRQPFFRLRLR